MKTIEKHKIKHISIQCKYVIFSTVFSWFNSPKICYSMNHNTWLIFQLIIRRKLCLIFFQSSLGHLALGYWISRGNSGRCWLRRPSMHYGALILMAKNKEALYDELVDIQNKIDHHPMISGPHAEASSLVEIMKEQGYSHEEIEKSLKDQGLPSIVDIGKNTISGMFSLWWLNYKKNNIEASIEKISRKEDRRKN